MIDSAAVISKGGPSDPALDQQVLFAAGMEHVRRLSGRIWTDHNTHDPGITTLELLAYALTDLSYRASLPIEDLVTSATANPTNLGRQFFTAGEILPNRPLTVLDYRKLVIDQDGVQNAWIVPAELTFYADTVEARLLCEKPDQSGIREVPVEGLFRVLVEYTPDIRSVDAKAGVNAGVLAVLNVNRNLCQEFTDVDGVKRQEFIVCAEVELAPDADTARVKAEVLAAIQNYLAPPVLNYRLGQMLDRRLADGSPRYSAAEIFEGPKLANGFIDDDELAAAELRTEIRLSDVISVVMDIAGVLAVRELLINPPGADQLLSRWVQPVTPGRQPTLNVAGSRLVFYKGIMPVVAAEEKVQARLAEIADDIRTRQEEGTFEDLPIPSGQFRDVARYHSFQNHFPAIYGVGPWGVASNDPRALGLSRQLKAYLLFLDQLMANYCAQLAEVRRLLSREPEVEHTYFSQVVTSLTGFAEIYQEGDVATDLADLVETPGEHGYRRSRFLDHLIGRFAERFHEYADVMRSAFGAGFGSFEETQCRFLENYPATGSERSLAENYALTDPGSLWDSGNVSGLERRVASLLGITTTDRRNLSEVQPGADTEIVGTPEEQFGFRLTRAADSKILLSSNAKLPTSEAASGELLRALELAQHPAAYDRRTTEDGRHFFNLVSGTQIVARRREFFRSRAAMETAIEELLWYTRLHYSREGMYLIENLRLRPMGACDPTLLLPICIDVNCTDCQDDDPYSYRIHVVLPARAGRFHDMDFRRYAEQVIRAETPAHILAKICWVDDDDLVDLERAYHKWLDVRARPGDAAYAPRLRKLIDVLYRVKNVYPQSRLADCSSPEDEPKFILGETALGTEESD